MPDIEWVSLYDAVNRLEILWGIPQSIAEEILQNAAKSGKVEVRGVPHYHRVPQIITEHVGSALIPNALFLANYESVEIDWNELLVTGRKLVPSWIHVVEAPRRKPRGPTPGTVGYGEADKKLFPEIKRLIKDKNMSANAAALELAELGKVLGSGTSQNRAKRLANRFLRTRK